MIKLKNASYPVGRHKRNYLYFHLRCTVAIHVTPIICISVSDVIRGSIMNPLFARKIFKKT